MRKLLLIMVALGASIGVQAQLTTNLDTVETMMGRGNIGECVITISNGSTVDEVLNFNLDLTSTVLPSGMSGISVCMVPGQCYSFTNTARTETIVNKSSVGMKVDVSTTATAATNVAGYVVVNTNINGGKNLVFKFNVADWATSIADAPSKNAQIYPNPAVGQVTVSAENPIESVNLLSIDGRVVLAPVQYFGKQAVVNTSTLQTGSYVIHTKMQNGVINTSKILVQQ
jgi:hypothetical protein